MKTEDANGYDGLKHELSKVFYEVIAGRHGIRAVVIFCYLFPEYMPALVEVILNPAEYFDATADYKRWHNDYLPMFLRLFESKLDPRDVSRALDRIAIKSYGSGRLEYGKPATLYLAFATLSPANQLVNAANVAQYLFNMKDEYYLAKFFFYWRRILGYTDHHQMNMKFFYQYSLTEEWLDEWMKKMERESRERIAEYKAMADADGKPLLSPDSAIIKDREGFSPQFIVLHSAGAGSPVERICANFLDPDEKNRVSAHFVVATDGRVFQLADLKDAARTNRTDNDPDMDTYYRFSRHEFFRRHSENANDFTITIECAEFGSHGALERPQYYAILGLLGKLSSEYNIPIDEYHVIGHGDISPLTKGFCPGSSFPLKQLIQDFYAWKEELSLLSARVLSPAELI